MFFNENVLKNKELHEFLIKELSKYPETPDYFEDIDHEYTEDELKDLNDYQVEYLVQTLSINVSDAISEGEEALNKALAQEDKVTKLLKKVGKLA